MQLPGQKFYQPLVGFPVCRRGCNFHLQVLLPAGPEYLVPGSIGDNPDGRITVSAFLDQRGRIAIDVSDNGPGINDEILDKIFVPYFTTKPDGSGIGLSLTRQIMAHHGGYIRAMNLEEGGASFKLTF